jgi:nucleotide-binding universal stress UspA family protein
MYNIIVPTDFSSQANLALHFATQIARRSNGVVHLLHVIEAPVAHSFNTMGEVVSDEYYNNQFIKKRIDSAKAMLAKVDKDPHFRKNKLTAEVVVGNPYTHIARLIASKKADLVVMGTKGVDGIDEILVGSNAEKVVRHSPCPVITVKEAAHLAQMKNVVVASNYEGDLSTLINQLDTFSSLCKAKVHLLYVNTPNNFKPSRDAIRAMRDFAANLKKAPAGFHIYNDYLEEEGIRNFAADNEMEMILMGTSGRKGLLHLLTGSIAEDVINHVNLPVWTFPIKKAKS